MMEKGWYGPIVFGLLATFAGLFYMARFLQTIFLDAPRSAPSQISEAPPTLLVSQYLLLLGILVMSFFPKLLIVPISKAIDPYFASTLVWQGMLLEMIYGYWNPLPVMLVAVAVSAFLFGVLWLLRRVRWKSDRVADRLSRPLGFYAHYRPVIAKLTPPAAIYFWNATAQGATILADTVRRTYTGNGQVYTLYVLYYFMGLYAACGGFGQV